MRRFTRYCYYPCRASLPVLWIRGQLTSEGKKGFPLAGSDQLFLFLLWSCFYCGHVKYKAGIVPGKGVKESAGKSLSWETFPRQVAPESAFFCYLLLRNVTCLRQTVTKVATRCSSCCG